MSYRSSRIGRYLCIYGRPHFALIFLSLFYAFAVPLKAAVNEDKSITQQTDTIQAMKYPPYNCVWEWQVPDPTNFIRGSLFTYPLTNGDILIMFSEWKTGKNKQKEAVSKQETYFGKQSALNESSNVKLMRVPNKGIKLNDGTIVKIRGSNFDGKNSAELSDKTYVISRYVRFKDCYMGPASNWLERYRNKESSPPNPHAEPITSKVIFLLLDKPITWQGAYNDECEETNHILKIKMQAIGGFILPLPDDTFLLVDKELGIIVRFNKDLTTRTSLLGKKLFNFEFKGNNYKFISKYNGKIYEDAQGKVMMQAVIDDLYDYLIQLRNGGMKNGKL
jgi:hypothetical protein